jgi:hypothetical protein
MKRKAWIAAGAALLLAASGATAQSLGDVARSVRKEKAQQNTASRHFDNDNLPTQTHLSVVGPETADGASEGGNQASDKGKEGQAGQEGSKASTPEAAKAPASESKPPSAENNAGSDDWTKKIQDQQAKIDTLSQELDLSQREYRLRAVAMYSDAGNRLRNAAQWDSEDTQYKKEIADKQQALDAAKQQLNDMQEQARKDGAPSKDSAPLKDDTTSKDEKPSTDATPSKDGAPSSDQQ